MIDDWDYFNGPFGPCQVFFERKIPMTKKLLVSVVPVFFTAVLFSNTATADCARIAYSRTTGNYGTGWESGSCGSSSTNDAIYHCDKGDCIVELTVTSGCGSIARKIDDTNFIVTGEADSKSDAGNKAMANCGSDCKLVTTACAD